MLEAVGIETIPDPSKPAELERAAEARDYKLSSDERPDIGEDLVHYLKQPTKSLFPENPNFGDPPDDIFPFSEADGGDI
eukprot:1273573-Amorphochlora_amoeboformis.AAC.1